jgi:hypothetical protein
MDLFPDIATRYTAEIGRFMIGRNLRRKLFLVTDGRVLVLQSKTLRADRLGPEDGGPRAPARGPHDGRAVGQRQLGGRLEAGVTRRSYAGIRT